MWQHAEFGMHWVELRSMWGKNLMDLPADQIAAAQRILEKYSLQVTDIASPLFKTDWPGAPRSTYGSKGDMHGAATTTFKEQDAILEKSIALAKRFKTDKVRCFDFWRLDDVTPYRASIDDKLREAAAKSEKAGVLLVLENEFECNTATGREAVRTLGAIKSPALALNWDPANAVMRGETDAYPTAWEMLPKDRIHHCHVKNAVKDGCRQGGVVAGGQRVHRLDRTIQSLEAGWLSGCGEPGDTLARRGECGRVQQDQLGGYEEGTRRSGCCLARTVRESLSRRGGSLGYTT